ncbi:alpha-ribazole phosphatase/probable phosphoglycerate mutase [Mariprofundus ferrinatatus]|uniref:Alpha-ribazole phosphatase/probable phosphoglycerate mutase n=1 Tax=Mariprofundus ferrinatatus TaxID=1921087 RepID=A0A2K8L6T6_9PROT|nr:histidine phosphatase family protein [Mariprofundus ferrinatatus]ATX82832.1 alpha-ribazole phosphatase/probable phosphoglycerate mutase [Mariprofundus ferrinatatus]
MAEPVIIDLLRHGEVEGPVSVARGCNTDVPLTETGWLQMNAVANALHKEGSLVSVATSPLPRCARFAEQFSSRAAIPLTILSDMREIDFGHWEGKQAHEIGEQDLLTRFMENPDGVEIPGGESFNSFAARITDEWDHWLVGASGEHRLLVSHGAVMRVLLSHLLGIPLSHIWRLALPYGAWSRVSLLHGEQPRLLFLNREPST